MGAKYAEPVILNLRETWLESEPRTPLICFLSMGSDPTNQIEDLAKKQQIECRAVSMGQGQEVHARKLMALFMAEGGWALLQNCHLGLDFLDELLEIVTETEFVNEQFRIWITTEVHTKFPIGLLQVSFIVGRCDLFSVVQDKCNVFTCYIETLVYVFAGQQFYRRSLRFIHEQIYFPKFMRNVMMLH